MASRRSPVSTLNRFSEANSETREIHIYIYIYIERERDCVNFSVEQIEHLRDKVRADFNPVNRIVVRIFFPGPSSSRFLLRSLTIETVYTFYIYDTADLLEILRKLEIRKLVRASIGKENRVLSFTRRNISGPSTSTIIISIRGGIRSCAIPSPLL